MKKQTIRRVGLLLLTAMLSTVMLVQAHDKLPAHVSEKKTTQPLEDWKKVTEDDWKVKLSPEAYYVLRESGTERPWSSPLNQEKRAGEYRCAGCGLPLFKSSHKFDSGTGWPSFFETIPGSVATKKDFKLIWPRTEYHCSRCGGHLGHVFDDGPEPTGKRYCNNGVALEFVPEKSDK